MYVHVFPKSGRVIIAISFGVAERLENGVGLYQYIFDTFDFLLTTCNDESVTGKEETTKIKKNY